MPTPVEERIRQLAARQHGVVGRAQLLEMGLSAAAVGRRARSGHLRTLHSGVYVLGPFDPPAAPEMAAVLAGGRFATLSHLTGAALFHVRPRPGPGEPIHVSVPGSGRSRRRGIAFHRVRLTAEERVVIDGLPVTSVARTLVDIAGMLGRREMELAVAAAERESPISRQELTAILERYRGHRGMSVLRAIILDLQGPAFTRSEAEKRCLTLLEAARIPRPHSNVPFGPYELDLFWPAEGVAIEVDGLAHHSSRSRFEADRRKDAWLRARGIQVVRLTWRQITRDGVSTAVQIGQILALARAGKVSGSAGFHSVRPSAESDKNPAVDLQAPADIRIPIGKRDGSRSR